MKQTIKGSFKKNKLDTKQAFREKISKLLRSQGEEDRIKKSSRIGKKLFATPEFGNALTILFYFSFDGEVHTQMMIRQALQLGKRIALPRILRNQRKIIPAIIGNLTTDLQTGSYGIKEPKSSCEAIKDLKTIDLVVVPGVAFDRSNNRLGRGGGYYDRFLKSLPEGIPAVGLAFNFQVVDHLPSPEKHDVKLFSVIVN